MTLAAVPPYRCILVAVDGSGTGELAFGHALQLARHHHARLHVAHVIEAYRCAEGFGGADELDVPAALHALRQDGRRLLAEARARAADAGVKVETTLLQTHALTERPAAVLAAEAARSKADLFVIATHGPRSPERITLGSVTDELIRNTTVPVLLLRLPAHEPAGDPAK